MAFCQELYRIHQELGFIVEIRKLVQAHGISKEFMYGLLHSGSLAKLEYGLYVWNDQKPSVEIIQKAHDQIQTIRDTHEYTPKPTSLKPRIDKFRMGQLIKRWGIRDPKQFLEDIALVYDSKFEEEFRYRL